MNSSRLPLSKKTIERDLEALDQMMEWHRFVEMGRMASEIFHDIRNPLTTAALSLEEIKEGLHTAQLRKSATTAWNSIQLIVRFIEAHQHQIQQQALTTAFSPAQEILVAVHALQSKATKRHVHISTKLEKKLRLVGNQLKFYQIVLNVLSNAIDAYLETQVTRPAIRVTLTQQGRSIIVKVQDRGAGMAPALQLRIFEPLYTTKSIADGTGLGLAMTKTAVEHDFGGTLLLCSQPGYGTAFKIFFPIDPV